MSRRLGFDALPWTLPYSDNRGAPERQVVELRRALDEMKDTGFAGVSLAIPEGLGTETFRDWLDRAGMVAAPGYFSAAFDDVATHAEIAEAARRTADLHAGFGLTEVFIGFDHTPDRFARPGQGYAADETRLRIIADGLVGAAEVFAGFGIAAGMHPHVGSWVETEAETRAILEWTAGTALGFGPDTAQLAWAGADLPRLLADHADRIVSIHLKDIHLDRVARARAQGADYRTAARGIDVWTEPGYGDIDFAPVFAALPPGRPGWIVVEVDKPEQPTPKASMLASLDHIRPLLG